MSKVRLKNEKGRLRWINRISPFFENPQNVWIIRAGYSKGSGQQASQFAPLKIVVSYLFNMKQG